MRVVFVVPRYGPDIIGGAETAARRLAEGLVTAKGWEVEVLTTGAEDFVTWADVYPEGQEQINGVRVHRFRSASGRDPSFHPLSAALLADPTSASMPDAERWLDLQGPVSPALAAAAATSNADVMVFYPYLYYPTARVIDRVGAPTVLHPAAHDEPALYLPVFPRVFEAADALVFQTEAERELVQGIFPVASHHQMLLGLGVDDPAPGSLAREPPDPEVPGVPYLVCLGRVDSHKGTSNLATMFAAYKERHPGPLRLVLAGPVVDAPAPHPDIDVVGTVSEAAKWDLLSRAVALVSPSRWEAFSLVIAEAWSARTPVVVNAACGATAEHARRSGGGLSFQSYAEFEVIVERLCDDDDLTTELGRRGRAYVDRHFRWPIVIGRYARFLESVAATPPRSDAGAQRSGAGPADQVDPENGGSG
jgi:glycosyltransferase involved in cell wall biosynthesis